MSKELNLCFDHRQESKTSHFAQCNCDYCKLELEIVALRMSLDSQESAMIELAEHRDDYKRLLTVALNTFRLQINGNWTNRKSLAIIAIESIARALGVMQLNENK
jgi:hypothetical protein